MQRISGSGGGGRGKRGWNASVNMMTVRRASYRAERRRIRTTLSASLMWYSPVSRFLDRARVLVLHRRDLAILKEGGRWQVRGCECELGLGSLRKRLNGTRREKEGVEGLLSYGGRLGGGESKLSKFLWLPNRLSSSIYPHSPHSARDVPSRL